MNVWHDADQARPPQQFPIVPLSSAHRTHAAGALREMLDQTATIFPAICPVSNDARMDVRHAIAELQAFELWLTKRVDEEG